MMLGEQFKIRNYETNSVHNVRLSVCLSVMGNQVLGEWDQTMSYMTFTLTY